MPPHDYSPQEALALLMRRLSVQDAALAGEVQQVVDAGKDIQEREHVSRRRKKPRVYRKTVPYSYEEALDVALKVLESHFVEQPCLVNSFLANMAQAELGAPKERHSLLFEGEADTRDEEKTVQFEVRTGTQILESTEDLFTLHRTERSLVKQQQANVERLRELIDFGEK